MQQGGPPINHGDPNQQGMWQQAHGQQPPPPGMQPVPQPGFQQPPPQMMGQPQPMMDPMQQQQMYQNQQMMGQPGQMMMVGPDGQMVPVQQPPMMMQKPVYQLDQVLMSLPGVFIKQKMDWMEAFTGCERPNEYYVYARHPQKENKKKGSKIFKYKEHSDCCERQCLKGDCKPFDMKVKSEVTGAPDSQVMHCVKECRCTYLCFNRSDMKCYYNELKSLGGPDLFLGKVYDPWDCCHFSFQIRTGPNDAECNKIEYIIWGSVCQWYFCCRCPCKDCQRVEFEIHEGEAKGNHVGMLVRTGRDCFKNVVKGDDADEFTVDFPQNASWQHRAMLMSTVVFIDYSIFEDTSNQNQRHG